MGECGVVGVELSHLLKSKLTIIFWSMNHPHRNCMFGCVQGVWMLMLYGCCFRYPVSVASSLKLYVWLCSGSVSLGVCVGVVLAIQSV